MTPVVSAIIPVYNRPERALQAVTSVLQQTLKNIELIVVDDGSTLSHIDLKEKVLSAGQKCIYQEHAGVSAARNRGILEARGEWIALLDSDDFWLPEKIEAQLKFHRENPEFKVSQTDDIWYRNGRMVNKKKNQLPPAGDVFIPSLARCLISSSACLIHRSVFDSVGLYNEKLLACEDYDLWLRIAARYQFGLLRNKLVIKYAGHSDQLSKKYPAMDRLRIASMLLLTLTAGLSHGQLEAISLELRIKLSILKKGSQNQNSELYPLCVELEDYLDSAFKTPDCQKFKMFAEAFIEFDPEKNCREELVESGRTEEVESVSL